MPSMWAVSWLARAAPWLYYKWQRYEWSLCPLPFHKQLNFSSICLTECYFTQLPQSCGKWCTHYCRGVSCSCASVRVGAFWSFVLQARNVGQIPNPQNSLSLKNSRCPDPYRHIQSPQRANWPLVPFVISGTTPSAHDMRGYKLCKCCPNLMMNTATMFCRLYQKESVCVMSEQM